MINGHAPKRFYLYAKPIDFRRGHQGLSMIVQESTKVDLFSGAAFIFRPKNARAVKILTWDGSGMVMLYNEGRTFRWLPINNGVVSLTPVQFSALVEGIDWRKVHTARRTRKPKIIA